MSEDAVLGQEETRRGIKETMKIRERFRQRMIRFARGIS